MVCKKCLNTSIDTLFSDGFYTKVNIFNKKGTLLLIANTSEIMAMPFEIGKRYSVTTRDEAMWSMKVADTSQYLNNAVLSTDKEVLATALNEGKELIVHLWKCSQGTWGTKAEIQKIKSNLK